MLTYFLLPPTIGTAHVDFLLQYVTTAAVKLVLDANGGELPHLAISDQAWSITIIVFDAHTKFFV